MVKWLTTVQGECQRLTGVSGELRSLADACKVVGLGELNEQLLVCAYDIEGAQSEILGAVGTMISDELRDSQAAIHDTFLAMLGGQDDANDLEICITVGSEQNRDALRRRNLTDTGAR